MKIDDSINGNSPCDKEDELANKNKLIFLNLLYPNAQSESAFDIAMKKKSPKSIETMLLMLIQLPSFSLSKWIMDHF